ncbi:MAG: urea ABC transporter permease subunit UrtB [Planktotalea sp.]|jgi:urea transport system permease protein|uniref:urea ABC transporter permease subunit UrtB n=1 Tax=Planktotalea sp. TaxID=2029877 RepID=UPI0005934865|nr:urea ABC transporter permease subunit UrtB [Planktotalea sp.]MBT5822819.1 urea ABC transporter permease subunit UrtB [Paracoccaceae bacterium]MDG1076053.1 urea ABC transporter permease subunit UrtB [Planktotalea sp.]MDG1084687.1 urea ABC transporter permease subunit UrtB [Planktotalea sp.]HCW83150.1 urea ABC transporter permease subunit UrtB [Paracoccaceae bacterium]
MIRLFLAGLALMLPCMIASAQTATLQPILQEHGALIAKSSRKTIAPAIDAIATSGVPQAQVFLEQWAGKNIWMRKSDGVLFIGEKLDAKTYALTDIDGGAGFDGVAKSDLKQLKPNSGVRAMIQTALVQFQLSDDDPERRQDALTSIARDPEASLLAHLRASIEGETDDVLLAQKQRLERLLSIGYDPDTAVRVAAIKDMSGDLGVDVRAALNPLLSTILEVTDTDLPQGRNIANTLTPESEALSVTAAYELLVAKDLAPPLTTPDTLRAALSANIDQGRVGGIPIAQLDSDENRAKAYAALAQAGLVSPLVTEADVKTAVSERVFFEAYNEPSSDVTDAAKEALKTIEAKVAANQVLDLTLDALSLASIYFLAAIGLAITFGVMGVINMAHGEFIMMGAYTGYVVQQIIPDHTVSIIVAIPLAFAVTFAAGVAMERLVIRWLYSRPLETLLATFGISIVLQQLAKNIFGTQARPLTAPGWLDGSWVINDVVSISYIRIAIFVLAFVFLAIFLFIMKRTRLGLETRAVTQNPRMAASMGINPGRVNMLTFGLGSGIAGVAGVAIGLFAKVTSELGSDYIVQSFMTVVVGGVGNIWGTLAGAAMIGFLQKGIEWFNPSNTLAAQTFMIVFIIIFIQFRPRGIIALKGRAAGD